jgi:8-oxo-dGTP pyrophosphatase MutT (NUDIX family)
MSNNKITCGGIILFNELDKTILLVEGSNNRLSFPKGKYEKKKDPPKSDPNYLFECAKREFEEETQITWSELLNPKVHDELYVDGGTIGLYLVKVNQEFKNKFIPNDEILSIGWFGKKDIERLDTLIFKESRKQIASQVFDLLKN